MYHHKQQLLGRDYLKQVLRLVLAIVVQYIILQLVIKQWGRTGNVNQDNNTTISIPISLTTLYVFVATRYGSSNDGDNMNAVCFVSFNGGNSVTIREYDYGCNKSYIIIGT